MNWQCNYCGSKVETVTEVKEDGIDWPAGRACSKCLNGEMVCRPIGNGRKGDESTILPEKIKVPTIDGEIEIEAMRFTEENKDQVYSWAKSIQYNVYHSFSEDNRPILRIPTIFDGEIICHLGDYLVKSEGEQILKVVK